MKFLRLFRDWENLEEYPEGTVIFSEKDPADVMYVIISGEVELTLRGEQLGTEGEGGVVGEMAMINSAVRRETVTTLCPTKLARLDRDQFKDLIGKNTEFTYHVMAVLANRLRSVDQYINAHLTEIK